MMRNIFNVGFLVMALSLMGGWTPSVLAAKGGDAYWAYEGEEGPANWGDLSSQFSTCQKGKSQSPIDILSSTQTDLGDIDIQYQASPLTVVNNGHTIQVNYAPGSFIKIGGEKYHLLQFHFHSPSEHKINGKAGDMVVHLVHKSADGNLAVIGVLLNEGKPNGVVRTVWDNLPGGAGKTKSLGKVQVNASDMIPKDRAYYNYSGSLTTPPCTEGVNWIVMKSPVSVSKEQVARFKSIFPLSVRPVQPLHGRKINANK